MKLHDVPIGSLVVDPGTTIFGEPIYWLVIDKNHTGFPSNSVTLISQYILRTMCFDAGEPGNPVGSRRNYGSQDYAVSNLRQWYNSDKAGWFSAQHPYDAPPIPANIFREANDYADAPGFLSGFSAGFKQALMPTTLVLVHSPTDGGDTFTLQDRVFALSATEMSLSGPGVEGSPIAYFASNALRKAFPTEACIANNKAAISTLKSGTAFRYWLRSHNATYAHTVCYINALGSLSLIEAFDDTFAIRPACNLPADTQVAASEDYPDAYTLLFPPASPVWVCQSGRWMQAENVYARDDGQWKRGLRIYG